MNRKIQILLTGMITATIMLLSNSPSVCQEDMKEEFEYFFVESTYLPEVKLDQPPRPLEDVKNQVTNFRGMFSLPLQLKGGRFLLINEFSANVLHFGYENPPPGQEDFFPENVYDLGYLLKFRGYYSERFWIAAEAGPSIASDLKETDRDHINVEGGLIVRMDHRGWLTIGLGAVYTCRPGEPMVLPALDLNYFYYDKNSSWTCTSPTGGSYGTSLPIPCIWESSRNFMETVTPSAVTKPSIPEDLPGEPS